MIYDWDTNNISLAIIKIEEEIKELEKRLEIKEKELEEIENEQ